jgi:hypothetical protein
MGFDASIALAFVVSLVLSVGLVATGHWHARLSADFAQGIQKRILVSMPRVSFCMVYVLTYRRVVKFSWN